MISEIKEWNVLSKNDKNFNHLSRFPSIASYDENIVDSLSKAKWDGAKKIINLYFVPLKIKVITRQNVTL